MCASHQSAVPSAARLVEPWVVSLLIKSVREFLLFRQRIQSFRFAANTEQVAHMPRFRPSGLGGGTRRRSRLCGGGSEKEGTGKEEEGRKRREGGHGRQSIGSELKPGWSEKSDASFQHRCCTSKLASEVPYIPCSGPISSSQSSCTTDHQHALHLPDTRNRAMVPEPLDWNTPTFFVLFIFSPSWLFFH